MNPEPRPGESPGEPISTSLECPGCDAVVTAADMECPHCGYPLKGSKEIQEQFIHERDLQFSELREMTRKVRSATQTLYVLSGLSIIWGIVLYFISPKNPYGLFTLAAYLLVACIYAVLGWWSRKQPLAAVIIALVVYIILQVLAVVADTANLEKGILAKVIIILYLVKGIRSAAAAERTRRNFYKSL